MKQVVAIALANVAAVAIVGFKNQGEPVSAHISEVNVPRLVEAQPKTSTVEVFVTLASRTASLYKDGVLVRSYPVGVGASDTPTPTGVFSVGEKEVNPATPVGTSRWIGFLNNGRSAWGFHGGDIHSGSLGCVRMNEADLQELYSLIPIGSKVIIQ